MTIVLNKNGDESMFPRVQGFSFEVSKGMYIIEIENDRHTMTEKYPTSEYLIGYRFDKDEAEKMTFDIRPKVQQSYDEWKKSTIDPKECRDVSDPEVQKELAEMRKEF